MELSCGGGCFIYRIVYRLEGWDLDIIRSLVHRTMFPLNFSAFKSRSQVGHLILSKITVKKAIIGYHDAVLLCPSHYTVFTVLTLALSSWWFKLKPLVLFYGFFSSTFCFILTSTYIHNLTLLLLKFSNTHQLTIVKHFCTTHFLSQKHLFFSSIFLFNLSWQNVSLCDTSLNVLRPKNM